MYRYKCDCSCDITISVDKIIYVYVLRIVCFFFFKQKTAYEMRISDWSSDVCSSDLRCLLRGGERRWIRKRHELRAARILVVGRDCEIGRASCRERVCQYV